MGFKNIRTGKELSVELKESLHQFGRVMTTKLPEKVEVELEKLISKSFDQEQYQDKNTSKWKGRKDPDEGRKLLIGKGSGKLRRSIEVTHTKDEVKASTDVVYAPVHNEGLKAGRGAGFTMPQRQYMPKPGEENKTLDLIVNKWMDEEMDKIFK